MYSPLNQVLVAALLDEACGKLVVPFSTRVTDLQLASLFPDFLYHEVN